MPRYGLPARYNYKEPQASEMGWPHLLWHRRLGGAVLLAYTEPFLRRHRSGRLVHLGKSLGWHQHQLLAACSGMHAHGRHLAVAAAARQKNGRQGVELEGRQALAASSSSPALRHAVQFTSLQVYVGPQCDTRLPLQRVAIELAAVEHCQQAAAEERSQHMVGTAPSRLMLASKPQPMG